MSISLVIPTLNAGDEIGTLLDALLEQTCPPDEVLVVDSSSDDGTADVVRQYGGSGVRLIVIDRKDFDHGGTRHMAVEATTGDYILFMTQDALPADVHYIEHLITPFFDQRVALVSGRQLPKPGARRFVQLVQEINYPDESSVRTEADIQRLGIKAFFCSDVCSAYRRSAYESVGGFQRPLNTNEDMLICARMLHAGWWVAYEPMAAVIHSHNLSFSQQFRRNREVGRFLYEHAFELDAKSEINEGLHLVGKVMMELVREGRTRDLVSFGVDCVARFAGDRAGRMCRR